MISLRCVSKVYRAGENAVYGVRNLNIDIGDGEFVSVMGPSGCGKSTLLNLIGGIDTPTEGAVVVDGEDLAGLNDAALTEFRRRKVGFVFQFFNLVPTLTASENVELSLGLKGVKGSEAREKALFYLDIVGIPELKDRFPSEMSGGQQQRVAIARALAKTPSVLLADEPTGNLDSKSGAMVIETLHRTTKEMGTTTILVTHDTTIAEVGDRMILLRDGSVAEDGGIDRTPTGG